MKVKQSNRVVVVGIGIIVVLLIILISLEIKEREPDYTKLSDDEVDLVIEQEINDIKVNELSKLGEDDRMEQYVSRFMDKIDNEEFEDAYEMLNEDFKKNYFSTLESFEIYAKENFPKIMSLEHTNIERNGDIYVLWVTVYDLMKSRNEGVEINFVVKENELNDFELSFSAN